MTEQSTTPQNQHLHPRWRKILYWLGGIAALGLAIVVAIPLITQRLATGWLQENGASTASIENIDINPFTGTVRLFGLEASGADSQQRLHVGMAEVDIRWWPLISKRVHVDAVRLSDTQVDVANDNAGTWQVGGLRFVPSAATSTAPETGSAVAFDWGLGSDVLSLTNVSLTYRDGLLDTDLEIAEISLGSHYSWQPEDSTELVVAMSLNEAPINLRSDVRPWAQNQSISGALQVDAFDLAASQQALQGYIGLADSRGTVSMDLTVTATRDAQGVIDLQVSGPLTVMDIGFTRDGLEFSNQEFAWEGQVNLFFPATGNQPLLVVAGEILVMGTQVNLNGMALANDALDWQGNVSLFSPGAADQPLLTYTGTLQLQGTSAELPAQEMTARLDSLDYTGQVAVINSSNSESAPGMSARGDVAGQGLLVRHTGLPFDLVRMASLSVSDVQADFPGQASVQALLLQNLQLLVSEEGEANDTPALFSLAELALANIGRDADGAISVGTINLDEPALALVRNAEGELDRLSALQAAFAADTGEGQPAESAVPVTEAVDGASEAAMPVFMIGEVTARATNFFNVQDLAVMPAVNFSLPTLELTVRNIDSNDSEPVSVDWRSSNNAMALDVVGDVAAFSATQSATLQVTLDALELPRFSSYIPGYNIDRGRLSTDSALSLNGEMLDVQNSVLLEQLRLAGKAAEGNAILAEGMSMPLDVALDLLRDGDDRISLSLPVTGSLSDPKFDSADIIRTVMQNALQNAAMSYVTNALQPLGTLLLIGDLASQASQPRFAPLAMRAAESSLNTENREYLFKIGDLLTERPGLQLSMCGVATTADREALAAIALSEVQQSAEEEGSDATQTEPEPVPPEISESDLLALAATRTQVVTNFLAAEAGISTERLFTCRETIDADEEAQPRVRISL